MALLAVGVAVLRLVNAFSTLTFFQPDEYWQALEPAHIAHYGYGFLTWEWREKLRSGAFPTLFHGVYILCDLVGLDPVMGPKIFQAFVAAVGDYYMYILGKRILGGEGGQLALLASVGSAFNWFCSTRTFSNSTETVLTTIAFAHWPWNANMISLKHYSISLVVASISCILRPTNALIWAFLGTFLVFKARSHALRAKIVLITLAIMTLSLGANFAIDYWYYGEVAFPLIEFIRFNVVQSLSHFYGVSPFHYYVSQGLPILLIAYLPLVGTELVRSRMSVIVWLIGFVVATYSLLSHKEVRFIYPIIPLLHLLVAKALLRLPSFKRPKVLAAMVIINMAVAGYFSQIHQRGVIDVIRYLRHEPDVNSVGVLMPCHSTPWQAHLHRDIPAWFLTCEPPLGMALEERAQYLDIADQFYEDPVKFLDVHMGTDYDWPSHLIMFEAIVPTIEGVLKEQGYERTVSFFNSHFHDDSRRRGKVLVYQRLRVRGNT